MMYRYLYSGVSECLEITLVIEETEHDPYVCIYIADLSDNLRHRNQASQEYQSHIDSHQEVQEPFSITEVNMIVGFLFNVYICGGTERREYVLNGHLAGSWFHFYLDILSC